MLFYRPNTKQCKHPIRKFPVFNYVQFHSVCSKYKHFRASVVHQMAAQVILEVGSASPSFWKTGDEFIWFQGIS